MESEILTTPDGHTTTPFRRVIRKELKEGTNLEALLEHYGDSAVDLAIGVRYAINIPNDEVGPNAT